MHKKLFQKRIQILVLAEKRFKMSNIPIMYAVNHALPLKILDKRLKHSVKIKRRLGRLGINPIWLN